MLYIMFQYFNRVTFVIKCVDRFINKEKQNANYIKEGELRLKRYMLGIVCNLISTFMSFAKYLLTAKKP